MLVKEDCSECEKETTFEVTKTGHVDVQGGVDSNGHAHNDDVEYEHECLTCGLTYNSI